MKNGLPDFRTLDEFLDYFNELIANRTAARIVITPELARMAFKSLAKFAGDPIALPVVRDIAMPGPGGRPVPVRVYHPRPESPLPVAVFMHGGGHMCGDLDLYDPHCRQIAHRSRCVVASVDYSLAPEHPYPAGVEDCVSVLAGLNLLSAGGVNTDLSRVALLGDSAGGNLAATIALEAGTGGFAGAPRLSGLALIYPGLDFTCSLPSHKTYGKGYFLEEERIAWYYDRYLPPETDRKAVSPLFAPDLAGLPQTLIVSAERDPLVDEATAFANRLREAGIPVRHRVFMGMIHAFMNFAAIVPLEVDDLYDTVAAFLKEVFS